MRHYPDWIDAYLKYSENTEPAYSYRLFCSLFAVGAALQRKAWFQWHEKIYPNMFIALSGPSGSRKNSAISPIQEALGEIGVRLAPLGSRRALSKNMMEAKQDAINSRDGGKLIVHSSITVIAKELVVLFGMAAQDMIENLVNWYDCDDNFEYETLAGGKDKITGVCLFLLGGITPELIASKVPKEIVGGGLFRRMLFIYAKAPGQLVLLPHRVKIRKELTLEKDNLLEDLNDIKQMVGEFDVDTSFDDVWAPWYKDLPRTAPFKGTALSSYGEHKQMHILKLSLISAASRGSYTITSEDFFRASGWLRTAEVNMLEPFEAFGRNERAQGIAEIKSLIESYGGQLSLSDIQRLSYRNQTREEILSNIHTLSTIGEVMSYSSQDKPGEIIVTKIKTVEDL